MAYKSPVTNKYMGSSFAGRVNPGRENELTQLARSLDTFSDALPQGLQAYKGKKVEDAQERLEELKTTMSPEELNAYILKGEDPVLSNKWAVSVVDGQVGRFEAAHTIRKIVENGEQYNFPEQDRRSFYNLFMPDMSTKSSSFKNGFSVHLNDWMANDLMRDAQRRAEFKQENKINEIVTFYSTAQYENMEEFWTYANSLKSELPSTDGKKNFFASNEDINNAAIQFAKNILLNAQQPSDLDLARNILTSDRGKGENGTVLGSLKDTNRTDVAELLNKINDADFALLNRNRTIEQYQDEIAFDEVMSRAMKPEILNDFAAQQKFIEEVGAIDPKLVPIYKQLIDVNREVVRDPTIINNFRKNIARGDFAGDYEAFLNEFIALGIPNNKYESLRVDWSQAHAREFNGEAQIHESNSDYKRGIANAKSVVRSLYTIMKDNYPIELPNAGEAIVNVEEFFIDAITAYEAEARDAGREISNQERKDFMRELRDTAIEQFKPDLEDTRPAAIGDGLSMGELMSEVTANQTNTATILQDFANQAESFDFTPFEETDNMQVADQRERYMEDFTEEVATKLFNEVLPDYLSNNIRAFVASIRPEQVQQLAEAYRVTEDEMLRILGRMEEMQTDG